MTNEETKKFIAEHAADDTAQLLLQRHRYPDVDVAFAVQQIEGRRKAVHKLPALVANPDFVFPPKLNLEQASSELTADYKARRFVEGKTVIDITGGLGIDSLFFARRAAKVTYIEQNTELFEIAKHNFNVLGLDNIECVCGNSEEVLPNLTATADLIYADPARRDEHNRRMVSLADCTPDIVQFLPKLFQIAPQVLIKASPMLDITQAHRELGQVAETTVLAVKDECRELLFLCRESAAEPSPTTCVNIIGTEKAETFVPTDIELSSKPALAPQALHYIYDPNVSVAKAGYAKAVFVRFGLAQLHPNTHLGTGEELFSDFPGRIFEVAEVTGLSAKAVRQAIPEGRANMICRNFPQSADELRKKLKLSDGGDVYLIATTLAKGEKIGLLCRKVDKNLSEKL